MSNEQPREFKLSPEAEAKVRALAEVLGVDADEIIRRAPERMVDEQIPLTPEQQAWRDASDARIRNLYRTLGHESLDSES